MSTVKTEIAHKRGTGDALGTARSELVRAVNETKAKVKDVTGIELRRSWVAPVVAGAAGLALALWLRNRRS